jgi:tRNA splicing endonuclease
MKKKDNHQNLCDYENILETLIEKIGGKEYCLKQLLCENDYRSFSHNYKNKNKKSILEKIEKIYEKNKDYEQINIIDVEISNALWNKYIMKFYFYDESRFRFFEYSVKTEEICEISIFDESIDYDEQEDLKTYPKSFYSKLKGGNLLWEKYNRVQEEKNAEKYIAKAHEDNAKFMEKMKRFKFIQEEDARDLSLIESNDRFFDGNKRFMLDGIFYYKLPDILGYLTFGEKQDILLEPFFAKLFYEKIVKKLRSN